MKLVLGNLSNLQLRVITAIFGMAFLVTGLYLGQIGYFVLFGIILVFGQLEFYRLLRLSENTPLRSMGTMVGFALYVITFLHASGYLQPKYYLLLFPLSSLIYFVKLYKKTDLKPFANIGFTFLGILYVALPFSLLNLSVFALGTYSFQIIMGCLLLLWASDTGAYFAGVNFGRTKLFERVSPKKSWEGSLGGLALSMVVAIVLGYYFTDLPAYRWIFLSAIIVIAGTYGDLVESLFKRSIAIKDSGTALPGHGGFLDRFDGLLLAAPFITAYLLLF